MSILSKTCWNKSRNCTISVSWWTHWSVHAGHVTWLLLQVQGLTYITGKLQCCFIVNSPQSSSTKPSPQSSTIKSPLLCLPLLPLILHLLFRPTTLLLLASLSVLLLLLLSSSGSPWTTFAFPVMPHLLSWTTSTAMTIASALFSLILYWFFQTLTPPPQTISTSVSCPSSVTSNSLTPVLLLSHRLHLSFVSLLCCCCLRSFLVMVVAVFCQVHMFWSLLVASFVVCCMFRLPWSLCCSALSY